MRINYLVIGTYLFAFVAIFLLVSCGEDDLRKQKLTLNECVVGWRNDAIITREGQQKNINGIDLLYFNENNKEVELSCDMTKRTVSGYEIGELTIEFGYKTSEETYYHKGNKFTLEPFKKYEILMHPYIEVDGDTISSIKDSGPLYKEYSFIAIPDYEYEIDMDHGDGETAMALTWNIKYFNPDNNRYEKYSNEDAFSYTIELTPKDSEKGGVSKSIDVAGEGNSCYFKPDNASEAYDEVYWYDGKSIKYVDAVLYDASVIVKAKIDNNQNKQNLIQINRERDFEENNRNRSKREFKRS